MKQSEVSNQYHIPVEVLKEYETWGLCDSVKAVMGAWQYDDQDLDRLGKIMALHDIGFENDEIKAYMQLTLLEPNSQVQQLKLLEKKRGQKLNQIHLEERKIERIDYLRQEIRKAERKGSKFK
ncbi:MerR family transcriptional regulator [Enterococcus sp. HY326]|uniref:MerR family transcriptional regulator n=1 Tax=Enterococcus sp. HY326 TaxID=2971265 RepID=UPI00223F80AB|nr:MerR family transcriptional regulator [Enterococcus sp. HY326]